MRRFRTRQQAKFPPVIEKTGLVEQGWFTSSELGVTEIKEVWGTDHFALVMNNDGISRYFGGNNGIAAIFACQSNATAGSWGAHVMVGYDEPTNKDDAKDDCTNLFYSLTGIDRTSYDQMTVALALTRVKALSKAGLKSGR